VSNRSLALRVHWRLFFILIIFFLIALALLSRLFYLQIINYHTYIALAARQNDSAIEPIRRGQIYFQDKDGQLIPAALNKDTYTLLAAPSQIKEPRAAAAALADIVSLDLTVLENKLSQRSGQYEVLVRKLDEVVADKIRALRINGIELRKQLRRVYPSGAQAAQVLGYVSLERDKEIGRYGIEKLKDDALSGESGILDGIENPRDYLSGVAKRILRPSTSGKNIILTIDANIQQEAEIELAAVTKKYKSESGSMTVIEPETGRILAMAGAPSFDPNSYNTAEDLGVFLNRVVQSSYELGSVMKPITMAAGINEKVVTPDTTYNDTGEVRIKGSTVRNFDNQGHGIQTMAGVLAKSLNTGAVFVEQKLGQDKMLSYLKAFGFGEKTGIDLPGEISGNISNLDNHRDIDYATASFGQGIAVTPLQMATALSVIANGGNLMKPYIVDRIVDESGVTETFAPVVRRRVLSPETADTVSRMLVSVVDNGFEHRARIDGYFIAGKTGTAQLPVGGVYSTDQFIHSFMGYAPAFNPKFLIFIQMNKPEGVNFASNSLTETFHSMTEYIIRYYGILPDRI